MKPRISVLLPIFNAEATLGECLNSLLAQSMKDFEIIAVDDGSTDTSPDILLEYARKDDRLRMFNIEHSGIVTALKTGFEHSTAPYLARMDADDVSMPERLAKQMALLDDRSDIAVVGCRVGPVSGTTLGGGYTKYFEWINDLVEPDQIAKNIFVESPMPHPTVMFRRQPYESVGEYQDHRWPEDYDLWLRILAAGKIFAKVPQVLLSWREHGGRLTHTDRRYSVENFLRAKAHFLSTGPLRGRDVFVWGAGKTGRRLSKHLIREGTAPIAFIDINADKIGGTLRGAPVIGACDLRAQWDAAARPFLVVAVASRGARQLIRQTLADLGLTEVEDYLCAA